MFVFAGIFALLAWRPLSLPGVFELAIAHKLAMTVVAVSAGRAVGATAAAIGDGALTVVLIAAYVLCRAWRAWSLPESRRTQNPDARRIVARARSAECNRAVTLCVYTVNEPGKGPSCRHRNATPRPASVLA